MKYNCKVDTNDYMTVEITDGELVYFETHQLIDGNDEECVVGLSKDQVRELIKYLEIQLDK